MISADSFEELFKESSWRPNVSFQLKFFLEKVYREALEEPFCFKELKSALFELVSFLDSSEGITYDNFITSFYFLYKCQEIYEPKFTKLPKAYKYILDVLDEMIDWLHDDTDPYDQAASQTDLQIPFRSDSGRAKSILGMIEKLS